MVDFDKIPTPSYVIDEGKIRKNCEILKDVMDETGCRILLAQKAFSNYELYPLIEKYLSGTEASGLFEARLGKEEMPGKEVHVFCGAYKEDDFKELLKYADHIVFNSVAQLKKFGPMAKKHGKSVGLRINPECSTQEGHEIYDPCAKGSRLGVTRQAFDKEMDAKTLSLLDGIHFHTLCEQDSDALETTIDAVRQSFGDILPKMKWLNMGGGHHITKPDYDRERLKRLISEVHEEWDVTVYLEPGEAVALDAGYMVSSVLDVVDNNGIYTALIDASAACHMPDVIEMPYTPRITDVDAPGNGKVNIRLAGPTCLAGDVIGEYGFSEMLKPGDRVVFEDMAIYSMCKNNTFNGMPLPDIWLLKENDEFELLKRFGYEDFKSRL